MHSPLALTCQALSTFWLDLERPQSRPDQVGWSIFFDVIAGPRRARRHGVEALMRPNRPSGGSS